MVGVELFMSTRFTLMQKTLGESREVCRTNTNPSRHKVKILCSFLPSPLVSSSYSINGLIFSNTDYDVVAEPHSLCPAIHDEVLDGVTSSGVDEL
jgi:hypothetical protein